MQVPEQEFHCSPWRYRGGAEEKCEEEEGRGGGVAWPQPPAPTSAQVQREAEGLGMKK